VFAAAGEAEALWAGRTERRLRRTTAQTSPAHVAETRTARLPASVPSPYPHGESPVHPLCSSGERVSQTAGGDVGPWDRYDGGSGA